MKSQLLDRPVGQLVAEKPARSRVFEKWGIDYCCSGKKALADICASRSLDPERVLREIELSDAIPTRESTDWTVQPLSALCQHIQQVHHGYLRESLPRLSVLVDKVAERHGGNDPRLLELRDVFAEFRAELENHTSKEDEILFPAINSMQDSPTPLARDIAIPIEVMLAEHDDVGVALAKMRDLTDAFTPRQNACNTHRAMLQGLAELEADLHQHIHKENNILFPRAVDKALGLS